MTHAGPPFGCALHLRCCVLRRADWFLPVLQAEAGPKQAEAYTKLVDQLVWQQEAEDFYPIHFLGFIVTDADLKDKVRRIEACCLTPRPVHASCWPHPRQPQRSIACVGCVTTNTFS